MEQNNKLKKTGFNLNQKKISRIFNLLEILIGSNMKTKLKLQNLGLLMVLILRASAQTTTITYTQDTNVIANPERGYHGMNENNYGSQTIPPPLSGAITYSNGLRQKYGMTTIVPTYPLANFKNSPISQAVLDLIDGDFATARKNGYKLMPHFSYCSYNGTDPTPQHTVEHLQQLKPIFEKNADVLCAGMFCMYGYWGEQWGTLNSGGPGLNSDDANANTRIIFQGLLDNTPLDRMFFMRDVSTMRQLMGSNPCPPSEAFTGSVRSRVGHYNDCFLLDGSAEFSNNQGPWSYTSIQGAYTPDLAIDMSCAKNYTDQLVIDNLDKQHFDFAQLAGGTLSNYTLQYIYKYVGYRYRLVQSTLPDAVSPGGMLNISIVMANDGFASIFNARKIEFILRDQSTGAKFVWDIKGDSVGNRFYFPQSHTTTTWNLKLPVAASMPPGNYDALLNLPDPYPSIHDMPAFSIHLANQNTWEATTGYNKLLKTIVIKNVSTGISFAGPSSDNEEITIYPNPFTTNFTLSISPEVSFENMLMKIYDVCGREIKTVSINAHVTIVERAELRSGIYFYSIINKKERIANGKLIVQ